MSRGLGGNGRLGAEPTRWGRKWRDSGRSGVFGGISKLRSEDSVVGLMMDADVGVIGAFPALLGMRMEGGFLTVYGGRGRNGEEG
jgi:hypothetical protein